MDELIIVELHRARYHPNVNTQAQTNWADPILTDQSGPHPDLVAVVKRHIHSTWRKPIPMHTVNAGAAALDWWHSQAAGPRILDSFCGTGMSTARLACQHPTARIIGIDKSADRLSKHISGDGRYQLLRAECEPFWRCLVDAQQQLDSHWVLYPNPWPKGRHLKRRIHGHPSFPLLALMGGTIELRSNWRIYVEEFAIACSLIGIEGQLEPLNITDDWLPMTLFERKYAERQQTLWRFRGRNHH